MKQCQSASDCPRSDSRANGVKSVIERLNKEQPMRKRKHGTMHYTLSSTSNQLHSTKSDSAYICAHFYRETFHLMTLFETVTREK